MPIKVLHVGVGPIGAGVVRQVVNRKSLTIVGAVDVDPAKVGRNLGQVCGLKRRLAIKVTDDLARTVKATRPDVAVLCTQSSIKEALPEIETVLKLKVPIVSTTEELAYPVRGNAALAKRIEWHPKRVRGRTVQKPNDRHRRLLRVRRELPRCRAAKQRDEVTPFQAKHRISLPGLAAVDLTSRRATVRNRFAAGGACPWQVSRSLGQT